MKFIYGPQSQSKVASIAAIAERENGASERAKGRRFESGQLTFQEV